MKEGTKDNDETAKRRKKENQNTNTIEVQQKTQPDFKLAQRLL